MLRNPQHRILIIKPVEFHDFLTFANVGGVSTSNLLIKSVVFLC